MNDPAGQRFSPGHKQPVTPEASAPPQAENSPRQSAPDGEAAVDIAVVSNVPTPYRLHVLKRISRELLESRLHSLFTHSEGSSQMRWDIPSAPEVNAVVFPETRLRPGEAVSPRAMRLFKEMRDYIVRHRVRMVILLGYNDLARVLLIRWARQAGVPLLLTGDSNVFAEGRLSAPKRCIKRRFVRWALRRVAGLMPMGTAGRAFYRLYADHDLPTFLFPYEPNYAAIQRRDDAAERRFRDRHGLAEGRRRLLYCGRLAAVKRVDVLIDAFARIAESRPDWDLVIAGDGPLCAELGAHVPAPLQGRVKWLGFLQFDETVLCYHACDALALPSDFEPWALVINEAVAAGLAVVATDVVGAAVELVRHKTNGLIVPPRNTGTLADALLEATTPRRCAEMRAAAPEILAQWRRAADPVDGVRQAMRHFGLIPRVADGTEVEVSGLK
jgi:glycosyltransferase involved in cell wall biosynthesis